MNLKAVYKLLFPELFSDVTFLLGNDHVPLRAHKIFLMTSSVIFHQLFSKRTENDIIIKIESITKPVMMEICRYVYTNEIKLTPDNMLDILSASVIFEIKQIEQKTIDFVCNRLNTENVFKILESCRQYDNLRIYQKIFNFFKRNYQKCFELAELVNVPIEEFNALAVWCKTDSSPIPDTSSSKNIKIHQKNQFQSHPAPKFSNVLLPTTAQLHKPENTKYFVLFGDITRKKFKHANLDITSASQNICLHSIQFIYDLKTTDKEYEISVIRADSSRQRKNFYIDKVVMSGSESHKTYEFIHKLQIPAGEKIWIRIEFPNPEYRLTYDHFDFWPQSTGSDIQLRKTDFYSYAEIIQAIYYSL